MTALRLKPVVYRTLSFGNRKIASRQLTAIHLRHHHVGEQQRNFRMGIDDAQRCHRPEAFSTVYPSSLKASHDNCSIRSSSSTTRTTSCRWPAGACSTGIAGSRSSPEPLNRGSADEWKNRPGLNVGG